MSFCGFGCACVQCVCCLRRDTDFVILQDDQTAIDLAALRGVLRTCCYEIGLLATMLFPLVLCLALAHGFCGADDGGAGCDGGEDTEYHICYQYTISKQYYMRYI